MTSLFTRAFNALRRAAPSRTPKYVPDERRENRPSRRKFCKPGTVSQFYFPRGGGSSIRVHIATKAAPFLRATPRFEDGTHGRWQNGKIVPRLSR